MNNRQSTNSEFFAVPGERAPPFSEAVRVGDMLCLSGIGPETRQALENIAEVLKRHNMTPEFVVKCTVMLADIGEWAAMNEVYVAFFRAHRPARSAFGTTGLAMGARLEIECMAAGASASS
jgi:2-iminobutanoate/2-iminopropanoate deaminase